MARTAAAALRLAALASIVATASLAHAQESGAPSAPSSGAPASAAAALAAGEAGPAEEAGFVEHLVALGLAREAGGEVRRLLVRDGAAALDAQTLFRTGLALSEAGAGLDAAALLELARDRTDGDADLADARQLAMGVVLLRAGAYPRAIQVLSRVEVFGGNDAIRTRAARLRCIGHAFAVDVAAARECVESVLAAEPSRVHELQPLLDALATDPDRHAWVGGILSAVVPGLGQLTAGDPGDAALALLVNGTWGVGLALLIADAAWWDAAVLTVGYGSRYYIGNVMHGADAWRAAAQTRRAVASQRLMDLLAAPPLQAPAVAGANR